MEEFRPRRAPEQSVLRDLGLAGPRPALIQSVKAGLPTTVFVQLAQRLGIPQGTLAQVVGIAGTTLARRKRSGVLTMAESEHVLRVAALLDLATRVFDDEADAAAWLSTPNLALGHVTPLALADTEIGAREVEDLLGRIEYGVYS
jgi:putative toxin-antitoxin system antitoxin component (TIGR02293 family)